MIDENGRCDISRSIIEGRFDMTTIDYMEDIQHKTILKKLIGALARKRNASGQAIPDVDTTITMKHFQDMFKKKNELTSCGPMGIIMPHWKIITENDHLSTIQAWLMEAPFVHGFTYKEWEISVHCMLLKDELPFYHRLRIIQLFEGDMNGALQLLFGKRQMQYMEENGLNTEETYGGRKGKGCHQALNRIQYTTLYSRTMRQPLGLIDVDATGCFDRMVGRLLSLINQCNGMSQEAASCQAEVLHNMKHYVKTTRGISENYIKRTSESLLEGNGQGNAASVPGWHGHNELMCNVYKQLIQGSRITSPNGEIDFEQWLSSFIDDNKMLLSFKNDDTYDTILTTCQKSLQYWEVLLNLTGGAVELKKCCITILLYKESYKWFDKQPGVPQLVRLNDDRRQCIITREGEQGTIIKQQDVTRGARLLGVKAAANGTFAQEYQTRLEKSREIAGRLTAAPLNIALSWQVYYCRWKPAITYCLPITTFNANECKKIQSPFYMALLPKLGMNRHMPRALLHGPLKLAGLGLVDLDAEQLALHVSGLIAQLRKRDRVGLTMQASIEALQIYLGIKDQIFMTPAGIQEHRPSRRESQIVYIWEELNSIGCQLVSARFWTPKAKGLNDVAIIDAVKDIKQQRQGTSNHLPATTIWYVNACRLYLRVTMLSDIASPCGQYIEEWAYYGTGINLSTKLKYPYQEKPPEHVWKVWRASILAAFLKRSITGRPTLHKPITYYRPVCTTVSWRNKIRVGMRLEAAVELLPDYIKDAIGTIELPSDNGEALSNDLLQSATTSYTDGTVKDNIGAHAFNIRTADDKDGKSINGASGTPGDSSTMTSLRAEHYGVFTSIILMDIITLVHGHTVAGRHMHYTDSQAVIERITKTHYMTDKQYDTTDYDIWKETEDAIQKATNVIFQLRHVKGHQKETLYIKKAQQGPLTREATYNDWCDNAAESERIKHSLPVQKGFLQAAEVYLKTPRTLVTASAYRVIYDRKTEPAAQEYVRNKLSLTMESYNTVNWEALGSYMKSLAISQRVKVMKLIYDWQNVGSQKEQQQWANPEEYLCPYQCGQKETPMHYIQCERACDKMSRMCLEAINRWMIMARTNNKMRVHIMEILYMPLPIRRIDLNIEYRTPALFDQAREEQRLLGWRLLYKGLLSKKWGEIQEEEYNRIREREELQVWYTGTWWMKSLIKHIIFWSLNEWQKRNEKLHDNIDKRKIDDQKRDNKEHILNLYQLQDQNPIGKLNRYYKVPLIEKLQQNPVRQRQWIETIRALRDKVSIQNSKNRV
jgi:ribonuclease HI